MNGMRIKCAAIQHNGKVYPGKEHAAISLRLCLDKVVPSMLTDDGDNYGFVTECGRFVRRAPALAIAIKAGQVVQGKTLHPTKLYSVDLPNEVRPPTAV